MFSVLVLSLGCSAQRPKNKKKKPNTEDTEHAETREEEGHRSAGLPAPVKKRGYRAFVALDFFDFASLAVSTARHRYQLATLR